MILLVSRMCALVRIPYKLVDAPSPPNLETHCDIAKRKRRSVTKNDHSVTGASNEA